VPDRLKNLIPLKKKIVAAWCESIVTSYPEQTAAFLRKKGDRFDNPVGVTLAENTDQLVDQLLGEMDRDAMVLLLDGIIRIRALQHFTASQAVRFVFDLKGIVADKVSPSDEDQAALAAITTRIDEMALMAFEVYMKCRETLYEIRANDARRQTSILLDRLNKRRVEPN
jgi:hypothetical protein